MPTYLTTTYKEREEAKALGARWDSAVRQWYVPDGLDLADFLKWLPADENKANALALQDTPLPLARTSNSKTVAIADKGISLSSLLADVAQAVVQAYSAGVWTKVEVTKVSSKNGHVYLELSERNANGMAVAQARAMIWASTANQIIPAFERITGSVLSDGIKLLVRAKPTLHQQFGFSLVIDEIDPEFTLGELEAKKREIRARLQKEGIFGRNRELKPPWDFTRVLVIAPQGAAGLGDFESEAKRLHQYKVCSFSYAFSRFQGDGAAAEIQGALLKALTAWQEESAVMPDAIVIIRGGGAVNDLAWLNDYHLARCICESPVPVLTGIGHERDSTIVDEVAHRSYDTPSKVIHGIEQLIRQRANEAQEYFRQIAQHAEHSLFLARNAIAQRDGDVKSSAHRLLSSARHTTSALIAEVRLSAVQTVHDALETTRDTFLDVQHHAVEQLGAAKAQLPMRLNEVRMEANRALHEARTGSQSRFEATHERASNQARDARTKTERTLADVTQEGVRTVDDAKIKSEGLIREITSQGPKKTLDRGFAIVRDSQGNAVTRASQLAGGASIELQLQDGRVGAKTT